jgi:pyruvate formate-lyase activating enzyme-like uncharacterized protein
MPAPSASSTKKMPVPLRMILEEIALSRPEECNLDALNKTWQAALAEAKEQVPGISIESGGEIVFLGALSPGCEACKAGTWDCVFTTSRCNLKCEFCYSPLALPPDYAGSVFGSTPVQIAGNHARTSISGVSFSGGEPFLEPGSLLEWVTWFKEHHPEQYTWIYTNGLLADKTILQELGNLGLDEIRFNAAASNYDHPTVMKNLTAAVRSIPNVTVEIPAIPEHAAKLLSCLQEWSARGVRYLNLHELIYEPGTLSASMAGKRQLVRLPDGHQNEINPDSRLLTFEVMKKVAKDGLPLAVNDCSLQSKLLQIRGRRRNLSLLTKKPSEKLMGDEILESFCVYQDESDYQFIHPDFLPEIRSQQPAYKVVRIVREAPLVLNAKPRWIAFEEY